ncbi:Zinc finger protein ZAT3 [Linum grandiflorum]
MDMALITMDQQTDDHQLKHFCKICKKGFACGRALGGHMRAHGIGDDHSFDYDHIDTEEDDESDWEDNIFDSNNEDDVKNNKKMYGLRTNPNRLKTSRVCENCDKEFLSWKSFLEHKAGNKCTTASDVDADSVVSSADQEDYYSGAVVRSTKRKRSMRSSAYKAITEEEDLANCLMLLSNGRNSIVVDDDDQPEESCASASKDRRHDDDDVVAFPPRAPMNKQKGIFECKACKKVFNSHQALGGHRASHKKVKGCFATATAAVSVGDDDVIAVQQNETFFFPKRKLISSKVHECSICHRVFNSGQALGGHKRCHWITANSSTAKLINVEKSQPRRPNNINNININNSDVGPIDLELNLHAANRKEMMMMKNMNMNMNKKINGNWSTLMVDDDEAESKVKLAKLSELKDINVVNGNVSSPWLQESCASASKDHHHHHHRSHDDDDVIGFPPRAPTNKQKGIFECKACKKVIKSHQALGGHRASHKKVKGYFVTATAAADDDVITVQQDETFFFPKRKLISSKVHECSICRRVFNSGQALGGHKRCHWITANSSTAKLMHVEKSQPRRPNNNNFSYLPAF